MYASARLRPEESTPAPTIARHLVDELPIRGDEVHGIGGPYNIQLKTRREAVEPLPVPVLSVGVSVRRLAAAKSLLRKGNLLVSVKPDRPGAGVRRGRPRRLARGSGDGDRGGRFRLHFADEP